MTTPFIPDLAILGDATVAVVDAPAVVAVKPASAIPSLWEDQRAALRVLEVEQWKALEAAAAVAGAPVEASDVLGDQPIITSRHFDALEMQPVTAGELSQLASAARGRYRAGDTRAYVRQHEETCSQLNCWMVRNPDGTPRLLSEPPKA